MPDFNSRLRSLLLCIVGALLLMGITFYNGYPLYDGDTHAYLSFGFRDLIATDRPPFYGVFIRLSSLWTSLWYTVFFQSFLLAALLVRYIRMLNNWKRDFSLTLAVLITTASFTCISWVTAVLMPDVFAAILVLTIILYLYDVGAGIWQQAGYLLMTAAAISVHNSNFLVLIVFSGLVFLFSLVRKKRQWIRKSLALMTVCMAFYFSMCAINNSNKNGFVFCPATQTFTMGKLASNGVLGMYLDDSCGKKNLALCNYRNELTPFPWDFIWPSSGSGLSHYRSSDSLYKKECGIILHDIFTTPKYLKMIVQKSIITTFHQLFVIQTENKLLPSSLQTFGHFFKELFGDEYNEFVISKQNCNTMESDSFNMAYNLFTILSSIWAILLCAHESNKQYRKIYLFIVVFFLVNAFVTTFFSMPFFRYQYRIFWLLPATNATLILKYLLEKIKSGPGYPGNDTIANGK